jgi:hypothetical protein
MYEYRVIDTGTRAGLEVEINKRAKEGWEVVTAYYDVKVFGLLWVFGRRHVVVLRKAIQL